MRVSICEIFHPSEKVKRKKGTVKIGENFVSGGARWVRGRSGREQQWGRRKYEKHVEAIAPETGSCLTIMYWSTKRVSE